MASIFTRIIDGDIPGRILWEDDTCVSFLDVRPLADGHSLVVPRSEIDQWTDLPVETAAHLTRVGHAIGQAQKTVFAAPRIGLMIAGFEVPHAHMHVIPISSMANLDFAYANSNPDQELLDQHLIRLRDALSAAGHPAVSSR